MEILKITSSARLRYGASCHCQEVREALEKAVDELREMLEEEEGPTDAFVAAVNKNISDWLVNHIKQSDKKVAAFVNK